MPQEQPWWSSLIANWPTKPASNNEIEDIVDAATRRGVEQGKREAWEEANGMFIDLLGIGMDESVRFKIEDISAKLSSLSKSSNEKL